MSSVVSLAPHCLSSFSSSRFLESCFPFALLRNLFILLWLLCASAYFFPISDIYICLGMISRKKNYNYRIKKWGRLNQHRVILSNIPALVNGAASFFILPLVQSWMFLKKNSRQYVFFTFAMVSHLLRKFMQGKAFIRETGCFIGKLCGNYITN